MGNTFELGHEPPKFDIKYNAPPSKAFHYLLKGGLQEKKSGEKKKKGKKIDHNLYLP